MTSNKGGDTRSTVSNPNVRAKESQDTWEPTRALTQLATQFLANKDDYLAPAQQDIGRAVGDGVRELFVSCDPALAMMQQFDHLRPEFIAVHDIGTQLSRKLLSVLAAACSRTTQKLVIRRQGFGTTLATLEFIELPGGDGGAVRLYTTQTDADTASRRALARVLLSRSRLAVVMVGDLPGHVLTSEVSSLRDDIVTGPWPNKDLLLLPLVSAAAVAKQGGELARGTRVSVRTTPQITSPADAWNFLSGSWHRLRERLASEGTSIPGMNTSQQAPAPKSAQAPSTRGAAPLGATTASAPVPPPEDSLPMIDVPDIAPARIAPAKTGAEDRVRGVTPSSNLERYVRQISEIKGVVSCCVFDLAKVRSEASAGEHPNADSLTRSGAALMSSIGSVGRSLGFGQTPPGAAITLGAHYLVLRPLTKRPGLVLHAVLDKSHADLTLARLQIERLDAVFDEDKT
ncbi:MAG: hypothetical protein OEM00_00850 [Burkholderiaceae bacterium]|nr:hypothetical protein [Burkholderiaceae bacterium]MDH3459531.1 hypothetical protein [Burkholderiaceae bacterium]